METESDNTRHIIQQYLIAGLQSREQALRAAQGQSADIFLAVADDFVVFSQLTSRWYRAAANPRHIHDHRHHGRELSQALVQAGFRLDRQHRLPSLFGDELIQSQLIIELLQTGHLVGARPQVRFRRRYQRFFLYLEGIRYPAIIRPVLSKSDPTSYLLRHLSVPTLTAFILRRDLQQAGIQTYIHPGKDQPLQIRLSCLEQLRLPFGETTNS